MATTVPLTLKGISMYLKLTNQLIVLQHMFNTEGIKTLSLTSFHPYW